MAAGYLYPTYIRFAISILPDELVARMGKAPSGIQFANRFGQRGQRLHQEFNVFFTVAARGRRQAGVLAEVWAKVTNVIKPHRSATL